MPRFSLQSLIAPKFMEIFNWTFILTIFVCCFHFLGEGRSSGQSSKQKATFSILLPPIPFPHHFKVNGREATEHKNADFQCRSAPQEAPEAGVFRSQTRARAHEKAGKGNPFDEKFITPWRFYSLNYYYYYYCYSSVRWLRVRIMTSIVRATHTRASRDDLANAQGYG